MGIKNVPRNLDGEITTNGTRGRGEGVGGTNHETGGSNDALTFPAHGDDGARGKEVDELAEEGTLLVLSIVLTSLLLGGGKHLETSELVSTLLPATHDLGDLHDTSG